MAALNKELFGTVMRSDGKAGRVVLTLLLNGNKPALLNLNKGGIENPEALDGADITIVITPKKK